MTDDGDAAEDDDSRPVAICATCHHPLLDVDTCIERPGLLTRAVEHAWLIERDADWADEEWPDHCRDCGAGLDGYHHPRCCVALCTIHEEQRLTCGCDETGRPRRRNRHRPPARRHQRRP